MASSAIRAKWFEWPRIGAPALGAPAQPGVPVLTLAAVGGIRLDWADSTAVDLRAYRVSRRLTGVGNYVRLTKDLRASVFIDTTAVIGVGYDYQIAASDMKRNVSVVRTVVNAIRAS